ncbi:beta-lactamase family protein [Micromonospora noduli]|nr:beta-lactamase family protein [Micromonospora noduli]
MRRTTVTALVVALIAGLVGVALMPRAPRLGTQTSGDRDLAAAARSAAPDPSGHRGLAVALVENGRIPTAGLGDRDPAGRPVKPGTPFEIGSVIKALTGMLLADQVAAGVVHPDDTLGATWPTTTGPARDATLADLASHRAGLPRVALGSPLAWARVLWSNVSGGNPYAGRTSTPSAAPPNGSAPTTSAARSTTPTSGRPCWVTRLPRRPASRTPSCCTTGCYGRSA